MAKMYGKGKTAIESEEQQRLRWQVELEFVQCLANPNYLHFLAQRGYFKDQSFINYLKYLQYWKEPEYCKYLMYPMCLYFLDLLQYEHFRREIATMQCCKFIDDQTILQWQHYARKRIKMFDSTANNNSVVNNNTNSNNNNNAIPNATINNNNNNSNGNGNSQAITTCIPDIGDPQQSLNQNTGTLLNGLNANVNTPTTQLNQQSQHMNGSSSATISTMAVNNTMMQKLNQ